MKNNIVKEISTKNLNKLNGNYIIKSNSINILSELSIIEESSKIHREVSYQRLFNYLKQEYKNKTDKFSFNVSQLKEYFPLNSIEYKILKKAYKLNLLNIIICNFSIFEDICTGLNFFVANPSTELLTDIYNKIYVNHYPTTFKLDNNSFLIYLPNDFTITDLRHEFIHFMQYIKNDFKITTEINVPENYFQSWIKNTLENVFDINDDDMDYFNSLAEYEPLINDALDELKAFKDKYYSSLSDLDFANLIDKILFKKQNLISNGAYLNNIIEYEYFKELMDFKNLGLKLIIYFNLINYRVTEIRNLLYGYFNKSLKPKF